MKIKKEYIILILIIIGLSVYLFMRSSSRTLYQMPELEGLKQSEITKIEISQGGNSLILNKKDNQPTEDDLDKIKDWYDSQLGGWELTGEFTAESDEGNWRF